MMSAVGISLLLLVLFNSANSEAPASPGKNPFFRYDADPTLVQYLQPNDVASSKYDNLSTEEAEKLGLCSRQCDGAKPMVCYYHFTLENYATLGPACGNCLNGTKEDCDKPGCCTGDGIERPILTMNRQLTAPSIQVCRGDTIVVDVQNKMVDRATTIHWHGVYQRHTPHSDGVPLLTQCPIIPETTFRYKFPAMPYGSFFFHSHTGFQKMDGLEGPLVIRRPKSKDPNRDHYDKDLPSHTIIITDWLHGMTDAKFPGNRYKNTGTRTESFLINGRSSYTFPDGTSTNAPYSVFKVEKNIRYRFRIIGGSCLACPMLFIVQNHKMNLITVDGTPVENREFDSITIFPGDRMDVVIFTDQPIASYWIQVKTLCTPKVSAEAILQYTGGSDKPASPRPEFNAFERGRSLNALDASDCSAANPNVCWNHINSLTAGVEKATFLKPIPDVRFVFALDEYHFSLKSLFWNNHDHYQRWFQSGPSVIKTHLINNVSFAFTPFPLLSQDLPIPKELQCPEDLSECSNNALQEGKRLCECTDVIKVKLNTVAEIIFIDWLGPNSTFTHPMHLHGTDIYIIDQGIIPPGLDHRLFVKELQDRLAKEGADLATVIRPKPCVKDTVTVPPNGYTVVRINFNNPGLWILHCHFIFHTETGMNKVFQVGDRKDFVPTPPNFPTCNDFLPPVDPNEFKDIDWDDEPTVQV